MDHADLAAQARTFHLRCEKYLYNGCERQAGQILLPLKINAKLTTVLMSSASQFFVS
jgi:hypothetical protein